MKDESLGGVALIAGSVGGIVTMAMHPTGHELMSPGAFESVQRVNGIAHGLAIASTPLLFLGALVLSKRLASPDRSAALALVVYGLAGVAVIIAATASGFIAPTCVQEMLAAAESERATWHALLEFNGALNQAFAKVFTVASSVSIALWSLAVLKTRALPAALGVYGLVLAPIAIVGIASGHLRLNVHGMGLVVLGQAIWFVAAGIVLWMRATRGGSQA